MNELERREFITALVEWTEQALSAFIEEHPEEQFYIFVYDCNIAEGELGFSLNTRDLLMEDLIEHNDEADEAMIHDLTYNCGNWRYMMIDQFNFDDVIDFSEYSDALYRGEVSYEGELNDREEEGDETIAPQTEADAEANLAQYFDTLRTLIYEALLEVSEGDLFQALPKDEDFTFFALDHDEEVAEGMARFEAFRRENS